MIEKLDVTVLTFEEGARQVLSAQLPMGFSLRKVGSSGGEICTSQDCDL